MTGPLGGCHAPQFGRFNYDQLVRVEAEIRAGTLQRCVICDDDLCVQDGASGECNKCQQIRGPVCVY